MTTEKSENKVIVTFEMPCCCSSCDGRKYEGTGEDYEDWCELTVDGHEIIIEAPWREPPSDCPKKQVAEWFKFELPVCDHSRYDGNPEYEAFKKEQELKDK